MKSKRKGGWTSKNIQTRTKNMIQDLEDHGVKQPEIAQALGYKHPVCVSQMKNGYSRYSRAKYDALRALHARVVLGVEPAQMPETVAAPAQTPETATPQEEIAEPTTLVAEALADLDQANLLFNSAQRRIALATVNAEKLAQKIREVGLN